MMLNEFKARTAKFLPDEDIARYGEWYEPAYMAAETVDKDDFCAVLKDGRVRQIITMLSLELTRRADGIKGFGEELRQARQQIADERARYEAKIAEVEGRAEWLAKQLSTIQSVCDRALAPNN